MRDDFNTSTKELLARRVGFKCSNPDCRKLTIGPHEEADKHINVGVAAHISAASEGGPRYNAALTADERKAFNNGIWLCQTCAKLIDSDCTRYTVSLLETWKSVAEQLAIAEIQSNSPTQTSDSDIKLIKFYAQCFDRPAFQDEIRREGSMENFDKAIEDTIIAINTGVLRTRDGTILKSKEGKSCIYNLAWRNKLDTIVDMLIAIRKRLKIAENEGMYHMHDDGRKNSFYYFDDYEVELWFDNTRIEVLRLFSSICEEAGIPQYHHIKKRYLR